MSFIYVASPYSHHDPVEIEARYSTALRYCASCMCNDIMVYSPVVHCHDMAKVFNLPKSFDFWEKYNYAMLCKASAVHVLQMSGWKESRGVAAEIEMARKLSIDVEYHQCFFDYMAHPWPKAF